VCVYVSVYSCFIFTPRLHPSGSKKPLWSFTSPGSMFDGSLLVAADGRFVAVAAAGKGTHANIEGGMCVCMSIIGVIVYVCV
jgi:hypothetical protein